MRTATEIRNRAAQTLEGMLTRPSMYGFDSSYEGAVRAQLLDLAFIDGRDAELKAAFDQLSEDGLFSQVGVHGALAGALGHQPDYTDELASIYARVAAQVGYFTPTRRLNHAEWVSASARDFLAEGCTTPDDVVSRLGPPSYQRAGARPKVLGYAGESDRAWLYFDFHARHDERTLVRIRRPVVPLEACVQFVEDPSSAGSDSPEEAYRRFFVAMVFGEESRLSPMVVEHEDVRELWAGAYPDGVAQTLARQHEQMSVFRTEAPSTTVFVMSDAFPFPTAVVHDGVSWRVDADALLSFRAKKATPKPEPT